MYSSYKKRQTTSRRSVTTRKPVKRSSYSRVKKRSPRNNFAKHLKIGVYALVSVIITVAILLGFITYQFLNAPFTKASEAAFFKDNVWSGQKPFVNLAVVLTDSQDKDAKIEKFFIFKIDDQNNRYNIFEVPVQEEIPLVLSKTEVKTTVGDLFKTAYMNDVDPTLAIRDLFVNHFSIKPDGYIILDQSSFESLESIFGTLDFNDLAVNLRLKNTLKIPEAIFYFRQTAQTNLNMTDVLAMLKFVKNTPNAQNRLHKISKYEMLDLPKWDMTWQDKLEISEVKKEGVKIFVMNASQNPKIPGLAGWGERISKNIGSSILGTDNAFTDFTENTIITDDIELVTVKTLQDIFPDITVLKISDLPKDASYNSEIFRTRVSLVLVSY